MSYLFSKEFVELGFGGHAKKNDFMINVLISCASGMFVGLPLLLLCYPLIMLIQKQIMLVRITKGYMEGRYSANDFYDFLFDGIPEMKQQIKEIVDSNIVLEYKKQRMLKREEDSITRVS